MSIQLRALEAHRYIYKLSSAQGRELIHTVASFQRPQLYEGDLSPQVKELLQTALGRLWEFFFCGKQALCSRPIFTIGRVCQCVCTDVIGPIVKIFQKKRSCTEHFTQLLPYVTCDLGQSLQLATYFSACALTQIFFLNSVHWNCHFLSYL